MQFGRSLALINASIGRVVSTSSSSASERHPRRGLGPCAAEVGKTEGSMDPKVSGDYTEEFEALQILEGYEK